MIGGFVERTVVDQLRKQMSEEIASRKDRLLTSKAFERDAGFIQGMEATMLVLDGLIQTRNTERANPQQ